MLVSDRALEHTHAQLRAAIIHRRPVPAFYRGRRRLLCPHLLGWNRHRRLQVFCYQYGGDSESGLQHAGASDNWRCLAVENLNQVELLDGPWQTAENRSRPQTCIEEVELDVDAYSEPAPLPPCHITQPQKVQNSRLAAQLWERGVPLEAVENAFVLAAARRLIRPTEAAPLGTIRSLAYFMSVIEEVLQLKVSRDYFQYLRYKLQRAVR